MNRLNKHIFFACFGILFILFIPTSCKVFGITKNYDKGTKSPVCEEFEAYMQQHWKKTEEGFYALENFWESFSVGAPNRPKNPVPMECLMGKSRRYIKSIFGTPSVEVYIDFFWVNQLTYCMDEKCIKNMNNAKTEGYGIYFMFDRDDRLSGMVPSTKDY